MEKRRDSNSNSFDSPNGPMAPQRQDSQQSIDSSMMTAEVVGNSMTVIRNNPGAADSSNAKKGKAAKNMKNLLATQAQTTAGNLTQKSIPTIDGSVGDSIVHTGAGGKATTKKRNGSTQLIPTHDTSIDVPAANNTMTLLQGVKQNMGKTGGIDNNALNISNDLTVQEQIHVGTETVIDGKMKGPTGMNQSRMNTTNDEEGMTGRGLQPKYSHRKNARHHMMKMAGIAASDAERARHAASHLVSAERSIDHLDNLSAEDSLAGIGYNQGTAIGSIHGQSSIQGPSAGLRSKKNSVDHVQLRGMLPDQHSMQVSSAKIHEQSMNRISSKKSVDLISDSAKHRLDRSVKLHELSRQQLQKMQNDSNTLSSINDSIQGQQMLPDLSQQKFNHQNQIATRNSSALERIGQHPDSQQVTAQRRSGKLQRQSMSQIKKKNETSANNSLQNSSIQLQKHSLQSFTLPEVTIGTGQRTSNSIHLKEAISEAKKDEMLIDDYNVRVNPFKQQAFNKISFKKDKSKQSLPRDPKLKAKRQLRDTESSAIRIVKNKQNKFNLNASLASVDLSSPGTSPLNANESLSAYQNMIEPPSVFHSVQQQKEKVPITRHGHPPQSAMMQGLLASSQSALKLGIQRSVYTQQSTERNPHQTSFLGAGASHDISTTQQSIQQHQSKVENYISSGEYKRMRQAELLIQQAEMQVTNGINANNLSPQDVDTMLHAYLDSLQTTIVRATKSSSNYSQELQAFVANACLGIEKSAKLRQKLLDEQIERFDKCREEFEASEAHRTKKMIKMKEELDSRPFQKNFDRKEDLLFAQEELESMAKEKTVMTAKVAHSKYSDAQSQLEQLERMFGVVKKMDVNSIQVSYVDDDLFSKKDEKIRAVDNLIKTEGNDAMRSIAKRVLDKFWRYFETADVSTQTEEKVIDALKNQLFEVQKQVQKLKNDLLEEDKAKQELDFKLENEKRQHILTKKVVGDKERAIEELEDQKKTGQDMVQELKDRLVDMSSKFKTFTDEINELKLDNFNVREALKSAQTKNTARLAQIDELEEQLRRARSGLPNVSQMQIEDQQSESTIMENTERSSPEKPAQKKAAPASKAKAAPKTTLNKNSSNKQLANQKSSSKKTIEKSKSPAKPAAGSRQTNAQKTPTTPKKEGGVKYVQKLDPEAEKKLRDAITKQLTEQLTAKAKAEAQDSNRNEIEIRERQANQSIIRKQGEINDLQQKLSEKDAKMKELEEKLSKLQQEANNNSGQGGATIPRRGSKLNPTQRTTTIKDTKLSSQEGKDSALGSSQFSIKPMQPKLDNITRTDDQTKEKTIVPHTPLVTNMGQDEILTTQEKDSAMDHQTSLIKHTDGSPLASDGMKKLGNNVSAFGDSQTAIDEFGGQSIPISLQNKQETLKGSDQADGQASNAHKRYDSADLNKIVTSQSKDSLVSGKSASSPQQLSKSKKYVLQNTHSQKVSQGSQVEREKLQPLDVSNSKNANRSKQNSPNYSNHMKEKYEDGQTEFIQSGVTFQEREGETKQKLGSTGENYYMQQLQGDLGMHNKSRDDSTNLRLGDYQMSGFNDADSDQTLYQQIQTNSERKKKGLLKALKNPQLMKLERPSVDPPHSLFVESRQYQIKQAANQTFGNDPRSNLSSNRDLLDENTIVEGARLLQGLQPPPNPRLEQYKQIVNKAYNSPINNPSASILLDQAKEQMDGTELKLLMLMLQMRGQFDRKGGTMVSKGMQTEGVIYTQKPNISDRKHSVRAVAGPSNRASVYTETEYEKSPTNRGFNSVAQTVTQTIDDNHTQQTNTNGALPSPVQESASDRNLDQQMNNVQFHQQRAQASSLMGNSASKQPYHQRAPGVEIGVQAGDDLIKVTMDRVKLLEKQRRMFFAPSAAGDKYSQMDGSFSPAAKHRKNPVVVKAEMLGDTGANDKIMAPSQRQQYLSAKYAHEQEILQREAQQVNEQYLQQLEYEQNYRSMQQQQQLSQMQKGVTVLSQTGAHTPNNFNQVQQQNPTSNDLREILQSKDHDSQHKMIISQQQHLESQQQQMQQPQTSATVQLNSAVESTNQPDSGREIIVGSSNNDQSQVILKDITKNQSSTTLKIQKLDSSEEKNGGKILKLKVVSQRGSDASVQQQQNEHSSAEPSEQHLSAIANAAQNQKDQQSTLDYGNRPLSQDTLQK